MQDAVLARGIVFGMAPGTEPEGLPTTFVVACGLAVLFVVCGTVVMLWRTGDPSRRARNRFWARSLFAFAALAAAVGLGAIMRYVNEYPVA